MYKEVQLFYLHIFFSEKVYQSKIVSSKIAVNDRFMLFWLHERFYMALISV